ncbi:MAG: carbohydrate ABC transporter substrate-binding protein [Lachnospiraceae bacterium]|nr:carbohydrate ABC transporter substrate-binding protein [Lachnospiraceae bacterium]
MRKRIFLVGMLMTSFGITGCQQTADAVANEEEMIYLSVLAGQSTPDAGIEDMIDEKVAEILPNVRLEWECVDWGENFDAEVNARFAAGDIPDILIGKAQDARHYYATGNLAEIEPMLLEEIEDSAKNTVMVDGIAYGIPYNSWYQGVIYNKKIFEKYKLDVPKSRLELEQVVDTLEKNGVVPFAGHFQENWSVGNTTMQFMLNNIFAKNPLWGDAFRDGKESYSDNAVIQDCMECNQYILEHTWEDALSVDQAACDNRFDNGEAAMYLTGTWSLQFSNQNQQSEEYGIFPYPNLTGDSKLIRETNMTFMKSATTEYSDEVDKIFEILISDEELMGEILNYTQTFSVKKEYKKEFESCLQDEINIYEKSGQIIEATVGNTQLIWFFQNDVAAQELMWLQGKKELDEVLMYADLHRLESIIQ